MASIDVKIKHGLLHEVRTYVLALVANAASYMTGGVVVAFFAVYFALGRTIPTWCVWCLVSIAFLIASFKAYRNEVRNKESLQAELEKKKENAKIREKIAPLLFAISGRRADVEKMSVEQYMVEVRLDNKQRDNESGRVFDDAYHFVKDNFGKLEADLFASESGFPPIPDSARTQSRDRVVYHLRQYEDRLRKLMDKYQ